MPPRRKQTSRKQTTTFSARNPQDDKNPFVKYSIRLLGKVEAEDASYMYRGPCGLGIGKGGKVRPRKEAKRKAYGSLSNLKRLRRLSERDNEIPKAPFYRVVSGYLRTLHDDFRIQAAALEALQVAAEAYLIRVFENANLLTLHSKRVTLMARDIQLSLKLQDLRGNAVPM